MLARWLRFVDLRHGCLDIVSLPVSERGRNLQCRGALGGELVFAFACGASSAQRAMHFSTFSFRAGSAEAHEGSKGLPAMHFKGNTAKQDLTRAGVRGSQRLVRR